MASEPRPYTADGRVLVEKDGYSVVYRPESTWIPFFCPICDVAMRTVDDEHYHNTLGCCFECAQTVAYPNLKRWQEGWRP